MISAPDAALIAATFATTGWVYTARRARTLARKQHTVNVMLQASFNPEFRKSMLKMGEILNANPFPDLKAAENIELQLAFRHVANHYEFISAGLRNGDFDERMVRDSERSSIVALFAKSEQFIRRLRDSRSRTAIYEHLEWLHDRWQRNRPGRIQRCVEWCIGRPLPGKRANPH